MATYEELREKLSKYLEQSSIIRKLSAPSIQEIDNADEYRKVLSDNKKTIASLRQVNNVILKQDFLPLIEGTEPLLDYEVRILKEFFEEIQDVISLEFQDIGLLWRISERLLEDAKKKDDLDYLAEQIDFHIVSCMGKITQLKCLPNSRELWEPYYKKGKETINLMFTLLEKDQYKKIKSSFNRGNLLVNSRYFCAVYDVPNLDEETRDWVIDRLVQSYEMSSDQEYKEMLPTYDWFRHCVKCVEYMGQLTEDNNEAGYSKEQCQRIYSYAKKLEEFYEQDPEKVSSFLTKFDIDVLLTKVKYHAGMISKEEMSKQLLYFYQNRAGKNNEIYALFAAFQLPNDYIASLDRDNLTEEEMANIDNIYQNVINSIFQLPDKDNLSTAIEYITRMMNQYIEIPGGLAFIDFCVKLLLAAWPQAYIQAVSTAQLSRCICGYLCDNRPDIFIGILGFNSALEVRTHKNEICAFAYNAALLQDIGKIPIIQLVGIVEHDAFDEDEKVLALHSYFGAKLAKRAISTAPYAHAILTHDGQNLEKGKYNEQKTIVDIVSMAEQLDEYAQMMEQQGLPVDTDAILERMQTDEGWNIAPYLLHLFKGKVMQEDVEFLLTVGRKAIYRQTYIMLKEVQDRGQL